MFDDQDRLNAWKEFIETMRFLFRHEERLKQCGWYSDTEFSEAVRSAVLTLLRKLVGG